ncbi:diguanylate cyclase [Deefgea tanakiae]|uniref:Diguanylate cyclase n=1 Tax=Deefgea tanakiae TaxID=2865840 RepID=A0ABX8Z7W0_9NEIS|nr:sensor domain-containing diguanylate cyclase [Deefgea tanakiae]QZA78681.1 diguanylate cyclase [Deefgea tanakiae]
MNKLNPLRNEELRLSIFIAFIYFLVAIMSIAIFRVGSGIALIWFANAIGVAYLSQLDFSRWLTPLALLLAAIALANGIMGTPLSQSLIFIPGNLTEIVLGGYLLRSQIRDTGVFFNVAGLIRLIWLGVILPVLAGSLVSAVVFAALDDIAVMHVFVRWAEGAVIGSVSVLPAAYWISVNRLSGLKQALLNAYLSVMLLLSLVIAIIVPLTLPFPYIYITVPLFYIAYQSGVAGTVLANMLVAIALCVLITFGLLLPPPTLYSWGNALFYLPVLATLIPPLLLAVAMDMNRSASIALQQSERRYRSLYQHTPVMMYSCDESGRILTVNDVWLNTMGYSYLEVIGHAATDFLEPESAQCQLNEQFPRLFEVGSCQNVRQQLVSKNGELIDVLMSAALEQDRASGFNRFLVVQLDISERVRAQNLAYRDALTHLPNRLLFADRLTTACQQSARSGDGFALLFLDLDHFKEVNDLHGHEAGDLLLIEVARRLQSLVRASDTVARLGGDEFVLLLRGLSPGVESEQVGGSILQCIAQPYQLDPTLRVEISASIGFAYYPQDGLDEASLLRHADRAMYCAKNAGRNCFKISDAQTP